ncbi:hypothetical protein AB3R30_26415 [Leptolyngbyaceae cyanobacterium UHCC 1019]
METRSLRTKVGEDGILKIQLPSEIANQELDIVIVFQTTEGFSHSSKTPEELGYSGKFLNEVIGSWEGEPLKRPEQLPFDEREEIQWHTS